MMVWVSTGEEKRALSPLEIGIKNQTFLEKTEAGIVIPINWFDFAMAVFLSDMKHTAQESGSQL